jgi:site-specific DNA-cytosine methylase
MVRHLNIREWPEHLLVDVDVLVGGSPCQVFSVASKRLSLDHKPGKLSRLNARLSRRKASPKKKKR